MTTVDGKPARRWSSEVVYWIVPPKARLRHGITEKPGAWPPGTMVAALCGEQVKIPLGTPIGMGEPRTKSITDQCAECVEEYNRRGCRSTVWDF